MIFLPFSFFCYCNGETEREREREKIENKNERTDRIVMINDYDCFLKEMEIVRELTRQ